MYFLTFLITTEEWPYPFQNESILTRVEIIPGSFMIEEEKEQR